MPDKTGIFDLPNASLIFWEVVTFVVLTALLYFFVYPLVRDHIRQDQQPIERSSLPRTRDRIVRLRYALAGYRRYEASRYGLWVTAMLSVILIVWQIFLFVVYPRGRESSDLGMLAFFLGMLSYATGELLYQAGRRALVGLLWVPSIFVFVPLGFALNAVAFWSLGTIFGTVVTLLCAVVLLISYGVLLRRYLSAGSGGARQR